MLVARRNGKIKTAVTYNSTANVRLLVSQGFINLIYFNSYPATWGNVTTQHKTCNHFVKCSELLFHLYLKFIWLTSRKEGGGKKKLPKHHHSTQQAVSCNHRMTPVVRLQMSSGCHLTANDWNRITHCLRCWKLLLDSTVHHALSRVKTFPKLKVIFSEMAFALTVYVFYKRLTS